MKLRMGPGFSTPMRSPSHPHWKIATTTPNDATTDSRNPSAALIGTSTDRNTAMSSTIDRPTTMMPNGTSALVSRLEMSIAIAVVPVTEIGVSYSASICGARSRIACTRSLVACASGALDGTTWMIAVSSPESGNPCATYSTSGRSRSSAPMLARSSWMSVVCVMSTATMSGPLNPSPNPSVTRS